MHPIKTVKQHYVCTPEIRDLLEQFRCMVNDCIRIGLEANVTSREALSRKAYHQLVCYPVSTRFRLSAISKAVGLLKNYRKALRKNPNAHEPYARKLSLVAYYDLKIQDRKLRLPIRAREYVWISLNAHVLRTLESFRVRSITLTNTDLCIAYEKTVTLITPVGYMGVDRNLNNVTAATTNLQISQYDLSKATEIKSKYRIVKAHMRRNDDRICKRIFGKYGAKQRNKVQQILHHASKIIVQQAKRNQNAIVMEKLIGIRSLYRKGNWQGRNFRAMMNGWSFGELQRQIHYKAAWEGVPVFYVNPAGTSSKCAKCGCRMATIPEERRTLKCLKCGFTVDRDVNAAMNIAALGALRFGAVASASEAMRTEPCETQQKVEVIRDVNADELTRRPRA